MRALLVHAHSPQNLGPQDRSLQLARKKAYVPPLGLLTVAGLLPADWSLKLVDLTFQEIDSKDWSGCDLVLISGATVQMASILKLIRESKRRGKIVAVGGPAVFHVHDKILQSGADFVVKGEGELTVPMLVESLGRQEYGIVIESPGIADMTRSPVPRYDLLDMDAYSEMSMQF
ncbi:MAG: cobalamin-dependent protein, partial [Deltaproteobacteria bacterium]|nr:cobalamin-dependent protein [Deltaproteobacteria bacterium]